MTKIPVHEEVAFDEEELQFIASRSAGPGGQNVNKVNTRMTARFDVGASPNLSSEQKERLRERLATRISKDGILSVSAQRHRTQAANRDAAAARLVELVREALTEAPERRPVRVPKAARERRLADKRRQARRKQERSGALDPGD